MRSPPGGLLAPSPGRVAGTAEKKAGWKEEDSRADAGTGPALPACFSHVRSEAGASSRQAPAVFCFHILKCRPLGTSKETLSLLMLKLSRKSLVDDLAWLLCATQQS